MNICALVGNVASDPDQRETAEGRTITTFRFAVSRIGGETSDFFEIVCYDRQAEIVATYCNVGRRLAIEGRLHHRSWKEDDVAKSEVSVVANRVELVSSPRGGAAA